MKPINRVSTPGKRCSRRLGIGSEPVYEKVTSQELTVCWSRPVYTLRIRVYIGCKFSLKLVVWCATHEGSYRIIVNWFGSTCCSPTFDSRCLVTMLRGPKEFTFTLGCDRTLSLCLFPLLVAGLARCRSVRIRCMGSAGCRSMVLRRFLSFSGANPNSSKASCEVRLLRPATTYH
jgi:hypothetical protein